MEINKKGPTIRGNYTDIIHQTINEKKQNKARKTKTKKKRNDRKKATNDVNEQQNVECKTSKKDRIKER